MIVYVINYGNAKCLMNILIIYNQLSLLFLGLEYILCFRICKLEMNIIAVNADECTLLLMHRVRFF